MQHTHLLPGRHFCGVLTVLSFMVVMVMRFEEKGGVGATEHVTFSFPMVMSSCVNKSQSI